MSVRPFETPPTEESDKESEAVADVVPSSDLRPDINPESRRDRVPDETMREVHHRRVPSTIVEERGKSQFDQLDPNYRTQT